MKKIFLTFFVLGGIVWLGGGVARAVVGFDVFVPGTLEFKQVQTEAMRLHTVWLYSLLGGWTGGGFAATLIGGIGFVIASRKRLKSDGWIVMCAFLFALITPFQGWLIWNDFRLWQLFDSSTGMPLAQPQEIIDVFSKRVSDVAASVTNGLSFLCAVTIVLYTIWRPLRVVSGEG